MPLSLRSKPVARVFLAVILGLISIWEVHLSCSRVADPAQVALGAAGAKTEPLASGATLPQSAPGVPVLDLIEFSDGLPTSGTWLGYPLLFDFNRDGRADLVASNREEDGFNAWMAPEKGAWQRRIEGLDRTMAYGPAIGGDLDADGIPELLVSAHTDALRIYLNDGQMVWSRSPAPLENPFLMLDLAIGNLNGDGFPDVVGVAHFKGGISVYLGDGKGGLRRLPESSTVIDSKAMGKDIELVDIDGDHIDDIVASTNQGLKVYLTRNGEPMKWEEISSGLPRPKIGNSLMAVAAGHFLSQAGYPELAVCMLPDPIEASESHDSIGVYDWRPDEKKWQQIDQGLPHAESYRDVRAADFNADGWLDLITMSIESGAVIYLGDGQGHFKAKGRVAQLHGKGRVALGDIDGDGLVDIAASIPADKEHPEFGGIRAFLNRPSVWK